MNNLFESIVTKHDTDKAFYSCAYNDTFLSLREDIKLLFEIGVNRGGSVRVFKEYFPNALIVGLETNKNCVVNEDRIAIEIGDATDKSFINNILTKYNKPDIVIDDGSHKSKDIKTSFKLLYPHTKTSYVIEDLGTQTKSFQEGYYINDSIPATVILYQEIDKLFFRNKNTCKSIRIYPAICFFMK